MATITLVTGNPNKLLELRAMAPADLQFDARAIDLPEIQSLDLRAIVEDKVRRAFEAVGGPVIVEDVSAGLDGLGGLPGPFYKFFTQQLGETVLLQLAKQPGAAVTIRCLAAYYDGEHMLFGEGVIRGKVVEPQGENGFGFDPVVMPEGESRTMAEMNAEEKNALSHRGQAFRQLLEQLR